MHSTQGQPINLAPNYFFKQEETTGGYTYYGFDSSLGWMIKRENTSTGVWDVVGGIGSYSTAWTNKASHTYSNFI